MYEEFTSTTITAIIWAVEKRHPYFILYLFPKLLHEEALSHNATTDATINSQNFAHVTTK